MIVSIAAALAWLFMCLMYLKSDKRSRRLKAELTRARREVRHLDKLATTQAHTLIEMCAHLNKVEAERDNALANIETLLSHPLDCASH